MKAVFRPFWSYDLPKTEAWLADLASRVWLLEEWNLLFRRFTFRQDTPVHRTYQIGYAASSEPSMSSYLAAAGWRRRLKQGKWSLYENDRQSSQIHAFPSRKDVIRHNRKLSYIFTGIFLYLLLIALIPLITLSFGYSQDTPVQLQPSPMWAVTWAAAALAIVLLVLALYSIIKCSSQLSSSARSQPGPGCITGGSSGCKLYIITKGVYRKSPSKRSMIHVYALNLIYSFRKIADIA